MPNSLYMEKAIFVPSTSIISSKVNQPKVTIAIPTFRRPVKMLETLESALNQEGFDDFEVMVVDNEPTRGCDTEKNLMAYADNPHLSYYKNSENIGQAGNWNKLYLLAKGEYVVMLHDDDRLYPDFLRRIFVDHADILAAYDIIFPSFCTNDWHREHYDGPRMLTPWRLSDFMVYNLIGAPLGMTMKRETLLHLGGFDDSFYPSSDQEFYERALASGMKCVTIQGLPFAHYNTEGNASSAVRVFLNFYTKADSQIFNTYRKSMNPLLSALRTAADSSFKAYKVKFHAPDYGVEADPQVLEKLDELHAQETLGSKAALRALLTINRCVLSPLRQLRRKKL